MEFGELDACVLRVEIFVLTEAGRGSVCLWVLLLL